MKRIFTLLAVTMLLSLSAHATYYLVGMEPFGNGWDVSTGVEMVLEEDGTYSTSGYINGTIYFVFADHLAAPGDWDTFNRNYRIGPTNGNQTVNVDEWVVTQKAGGDSGAYRFTGFGAEYTVIYNPYISEFSIQGDGLIPVDYYVVAGTPVSVFGTEWDPNNLDNCMTKGDDGIYRLVKEGCQLSGSELFFKVVRNGDWFCTWPEGGNFVVTVDESGFYDVEIKFDPNTEEVSVVTTKREYEPKTGELYILGEVNGHGWSPNSGVPLTTTDGNIFTATVTLAGENIDENDGIGYSYFSFTSKLAENADDWGSIAPYRIGSLYNDFLISEDLLGLSIYMGGFGTSNSFKVPAGTYDLTVDLDEQTILVNKHSGSTIPGDVDGDLEVNVSDVIALIDMVLNGVNDMRGDVNGDQDVNVEDVVALIDMILNGTTIVLHPGHWLVLIDKNGNEVWTELYESADASYACTADLRSDIYGDWDYIDYSSRPRVSFYFVVDDIAYGALENGTKTVLGYPSENPLLKGKNCYTLPFGYKYVLGISTEEEDVDMGVYATQVGLAQP